MLILYENAAFPFINWLSDNKQKMFVRRKKRTNTDLSMEIWYLVKNDIVWWFKDIFDFKYLQLLAAFLSVFLSIRVKHRWGLSYNDKVL